MTTKLIRTGLLAFTIVVTSCLGLDNNTIPLTVLVPENFEGQVVIFYDQTTGEDLKYEGKRLILSVPADSIVRTKYDPGKYQTWDIIFYSVDQKGSRRQIKGYNPSFQDADEDSDTTSIHFIADKNGIIDHKSFQSFYIQVPPLSTPEVDKVMQMMKDAK